MKVSDRSDPVKETLTYAVLDDQSTDVFITDALKSKLNLKGAEVHQQVNTIVSTNTVRMRRVPGLEENIHPLKFFMLMLNRRSQEHTVTLPLLT